MLLAACLILEAGGEDNLQSMWAVKEVVDNRARQSKKSLEDVLLAPKQFSCFNGLKPEDAINRARKHPKWEKALGIAISEARLTNYTKGADHYHAIYIKAPYWTANMELTVIIQNHKFYKQ